MHRSITPSSLLIWLLLAVGFAAQAVAEAGDAHWPSFRGPQAAGTAAAEAPLTWNVETGENIRWKTPIPGLGLSSPIVWGDRVYVTTAVAQKGKGDLKVGLYGDIGAADDGGVQSWRLYALDAGSGAVVWQRVLHEGPPAIQRHTKASHANSTPATDGEHVAVFLGSEGLHVYGVDGELRWKKDFGVLNAAFFMVPTAQWGFGSSPVIHDGKLVVQADVIDDSFLAVFDVRDGREIWRVDRKDLPTWSTPTVVETAGGKAQVVVNGFKHMGGYDFATGEVLWRLGGGGDIPIPTPIVAGDLVILTNSHGGKSPVYAIRPAAARGDISLERSTTANEHIAWSVPRGGAYMPTPIVVGDDLYVLRGNGVLTVFGVKTGAERAKGRVAKSEAFTASPVAAGGRIYYTSESGTIHVVKAGHKLEELAANDLDEIVLASPALADGVIYFRGRRHLFAVGETQADSDSEPSP